MKSKKKEVTIYDIARQFNLSPSTVSRALNNHPAISDKTKKRILAYAKKLGYQANKFASALSKGQTNTIGVIVQKLDSQFISSALAGMEQVAQVAGFNMIISQSLEMEAKEKSNAETMFNSRVDGLIVSLASDTVDLSHFKPFIAKNIPLIFFDRISEDFSCPVIVIDNHKAGYEATSHLINQGCKRIVHISGNQLRNVYAERFSGYKKALKKASIAFKKELIFFTRLDIQAGIETAEEVLKMKPLPDGIFAANDLCAVACIQRLKKAGVRIPEDIAVVGFNNDPISEFIEPNLSTVNYPSRLMGETAVKMLIELMRSKTAVNKKSKILIHSELIVRESSIKKK
jgi:LacI family transcriptional regulator